MTLVIQQNIVTDNIKSQNCNFWAACNYNTFNSLQHFFLMSIILEQHKIKICLIT